MGPGFEPRAGFTPRPAAREALSPAGPFARSSRRPATPPPTSGEGWFGRACRDGAEFEPRASFTPRPAAREALSPAGPFARSSRRPATPPPTSGEGWFGRVHGASEGMVRTDGAPLSRPLPHKLRGGEVTRAAMPERDRILPFPCAVYGGRGRGMGGAVGRQDAIRRASIRRIQGGPSAFQTVWCVRRRPPLPASPPQTAWGRGDARRN
jgi:hypothetical protein